MSFCCFAVDNEKQVGAIILSHLFNFLTSFICRKLDAFFATIKLDAVRYLAVIMMIIDHVVGAFVVNIKWILAGHQNGLQYIYALAFHACQTA